MNLFEIFSFGLIFLSLKKLPSYGKELDLLLVDSIIEIPGDGETLIDLRTYPEVDTDQHTEAKRFKLCEKGLELLYNLKLDELIEFQDDIAMNQLQRKGYVIVESRSPHTGKIVSAYKCPTSPPTYIQANLDHRPYEKNSKFLLIFKIFHSSSLSLDEIIDYDLVIAHKIIEVDVTIIKSLSLYRLRDASHAYDAEEWAEEEKLKMCRKAMQHIIVSVPTGLDIHFLENTGIGKVKYYFLVTKVRHQEKDKIVKGFHCPTEPKIHVYVKKSEGRGGLVVKGIVERCKIKRRGVTFLEGEAVERLSCNTFSSDSFVERLSASSSCSPEEFFRARREREHFIRRPEIDSETKNRICLSILSNSWYRDKKPIDMSTVSEEIFTTFPDLFDKYLEIDESAFSVFFPMYKTANPTKSMKVYIHEDEEPILENVFTCLVGWKIESGRMHYEKFFVSDEYNMNYASDSSRNYIAGRFIFNKGNDDRVELHAVAEEPARAVLQPDTLFKNVELFYLQNCSTRQPAEYESEDPICQLDEKQKFRLCGLIFTSEYYDGKIKFPTSNVSRLHKCSRNTITFRNKYIKAMTNGEEYEEWMVVCYKFYDLDNRQNQRSNPLEYLVSRAYNGSDHGAISANDVFVYTHEFDGYFLQNSFTNIRL